jgi:hypothetical protein
VAAIGMKSFGGGNLESGGKILASGIVTPEECLRFALSQEIASLVVGVDSMKVLLQDVAAADDFRPMTQQEIDALFARVKAVAGDGRLEPSKSTQLYDGPYHRRQHGFEA